MLASRVLQWLLRSPAFIESRMRVIYSRPSTITPERVAAYHAMLSDAACQRAVIATLQAWDLRPVERDLSRVRQPTLVIWGTRDRIIRPSFARRLVGDLPQAELRLLPCGHAPQEEMPKEFARLVTDFLQAAARE
jgi:pimeloyl-ACP methyl ester carboxylesterase